MKSLPVRYKGLRLTQGKRMKVKSVPGRATKTRRQTGARNLALTEAEILKTLRRVKGKGRVKRLFGR